MSARCFSEPIPASPKITPLGRRLSESQSTSVWGYHPFHPFKPCFAQMNQSESKIQENPYRIADVVT